MARRPPPNWPGAIPVQTWPCCVWMEAKNASLRPRPAREARIGQLVLALGRPTDAGIEASLGVVSAMGGPPAHAHGSIDKYIRTDATPYPGFSGGPLVDAEGQVVGVNNLRLWTRRGAHHPG